MDNDPADKLVRLATAALDRVVAEGSELADLWEGADEWLDAVKDIRRRLAG